MEIATARRAVDYAAELYPVNAGIIFFGGEPLLRLDLIRDTIDYCKRVEKERNAHFHHKVTTNGTLLDEAFLEYAREAGLAVALSFDGVREAHDAHRKFPSGAGTFEALESKIKLLLKHQPYASFFMTVSPETVAHYAESAKFLFSKGVRYLIVSLNYAGAWTDAHLKVLKKQYAKLADLYQQMTIKERKFYLSPFEVKLSSHIRGEDHKCHRCALGMRQVSVAPDGTIYPCVQFVKDGESNRDFSIGDVWKGIDESKRDRMYELSQRRTPECESCALLPRCNNDCSCLNWQTTGVINEVSPLLCETERMLIPIADRLGERLYKKRAPMFIQKHYNAVYPLLSLLEDQETGR
jgi:uncharacterized protein